MLFRSGAEVSERRFQKARRIMFESNIRLVFYIAGKFVNNGLSLDDLVQEGSIGLLRAVEKFDYRLGYKFSTYASTWIWQAVTRAIANQRRTVRVPAHLHDKMLKVRSVAASIERRGARAEIVAFSNGAARVEYQAPPTAVHVVTGLEAHSRVAAVLSSDSDGCHVAWVRDASGPVVADASGTLRATVTACSVAGLATMAMVPNEAMRWPKRGRSPSVQPSRSASARFSSTAICLGSRCAPPSGSLTILSTRFSAFRRCAVRPSASAASEARSAVFQRMEIGRAHV